ncbi:hypothetical protein N9W89_01115 [Hellea sp.]|nr:hypothetical protein [Hellea sp.]
MKLRLTEEALLDLKSITNYFGAISTQTLSNIRVDIAQAFEFIRTHPKAGLNINAEGTQRVITRKYSFIIVYDTYPTELEIIGIYRYQNRDYS